MEFIRNIHSLFTTVIATTIIIILKIIWSFLFLNKLPKDQSNPEPTAPGVAIFVH
jgi:hypothetical protein